MLVKSGVWTKTVNILKNLKLQEKALQIINNLQLLLPTIYFWKLKY